MYFFFGDGLLGNQLFQFQFLKTHIKKNQTVFCTNFIELNKLIDFDNKIKFVIIKNKILVFFIRKILIWFFVLLSKLKIISSINIERKKIYENKLEKKKIIIKNGLSDITFIYPRFFQSEFFFKKLKDVKINIKLKHINSAKKFLSKIPLNKNLIFVHYRQGRKNIIDHRFKYNLDDYKKIKFLGLEGIALPDNYYFDLINLLKKRVRNPYFIILSDNSNRAKKTFSYLKNKIISKNNLCVDLTIMSLCNYGIMSNSSISWWGGYLMKKRKILFGPKYWLGWKRKIEFQSGGEPSFAKLVDPNKYIY